jgi:mutator protein MutT
VEVAAGLVFRDGRVLITQRPAQGHLAGLWEFPGGKLEAGETPAQCLIRELREELDIEVEVTEWLEQVTHPYAGKTVRLDFFRCRWLRREPRALGCSAFKWVTADELGAHELPAADASLLRRLARSPALWR